MREKHESFNFTFQSLFPERSHSNINSLIDYLILNFKLVIAYHGQKLSVNKIAYTYVNHKLR